MKHFKFRGRIYNRVLLINDWNRCFTWSIQIDIIEWDIKGYTKIISNWAKKAPSLGLNRGGGSCAEILPKDITLNFVCYQFQEYDTYSF